MQKNKLFFVFSLVLVLISCGPSLTDVREEYITAHPTLDARTKDAISKAEVINGMTPDEVKASWGDPDKVYKGGEGVTYYDYMGYRHKHDTVIFGKEGKVINVIHRR